MTVIVPSRKGVFVKNHIDALRQDKGEEAVTLLEERFGKSLNFKNSDDIPIADEVKLITIATQLRSEKPIPEDQLQFESGRQHLRDSLTGPFGHVMAPLFSKEKFKYMAMSFGNVAKRMYTGIDFHTTDLGGNGVKVTMQDNSYPLEHFKGVLQEGMNQSGLHGTVTAEKKGHLYEYILKWQ